MSRSHGSALGWANLYFNRRDYGRQREQQENALGYINQLNAGQTPQSYEGISPAQAAELQKYQTDLGAAQQQQGINNAYGNAVTLGQHGGPLAQAGANGYEQVNDRYPTRMENLRQFAQYGDDGMKSFDTFNKSLTGVQDRKTLEDFRMEPGNQFAPDLPEAPKLETFGQPVQGVNSEGQPGFFRAGSRGTVQPVDGYSPMPKRGMVIETGPDGVTRIRTNAEQGQPQSKGRTAADKEFAKVYVDYKAAGGFADIGKQLGQLKQVAGELASGKDSLTGPVIGSTPDSLLKFVNPEAIATREAVEEVVQRNLRLVLGAQFTEKEGERLIARAYNPNLSEQENSQRVLRLYNQMLSAARAKQSASDYFETRGTLTGWKGKLFTTDDFLSEFSGEEGGEQPGGLVVGATEDGYRFLGGNPADQTSWEKVN